MQPDKQRDYVGQASRRRLSSAPGVVPGERNDLTIICATVH